MQLIKLKEQTLKLNRPLIMGVLNVTPDSFSDGNKFLAKDKAIAHAKQMIKGGADIIDIGGESSRPNSARISKEEELKRILPVLKTLLKQTTVPLSIDTMKPEVADVCLSLGAHMLNDVTGLRNPKMISTAAKHNIPTIIMHMQGTPETMQLSPAYKNVVKEIKSYLKIQAAKAKKAGIRQIIIDPGIGFGKTVEHNLQILKNLKEFKELGYPLLVGPSRKSFIGKLLNLNINQRLEGTLAAVAVCILNGADIIRVHDVKECKRAAVIAEAIKNA